MLEKRKTFKIYIYAFLIITSELLGFYRNTPLYNYLGVNDFIYLMTIILSLLYIILTRDIILYKPNKRNGMGIFYSFTLIVIADIVASYIRFGQSITQVISISYFYFIIPLAGIILYKNIKNESDCEMIEEAIVNVATMLALISFVQFVLYFAHVNFLAACTGERYGTARVIIGQQIQICGLFFSYARMRFTHKNKYKICTFLLLFSFVFIIKTRGLWIYLGASLIVFEVLKKNIRIKRWIFIISFIAVLLACYLMTQEESVLTNFDSGDSHVIWRLRTSAWYFNQIIESPIFGLGLIKAIKGTESYTLLMGTWGRAFRGDVGLLGFANAFGIVGLMWFFYYIKSYFTRVKDMARRKKMRFASPYMCYLYFAIIGSISFSIMANSQLIMIPVMTALLIRRNQFVEVVQ